MKKLDIIILASGLSRRFGSNKLMYMIGNKRMFEYIIDKFVHLKKEKKEIDRIIVVSSYKEIKTYIDNINKEERSLYYIENNFSERGQSFSLRLGIENSRLENDMMFMVADQPYIEEETLRNFIREYVNQPKGLGVLKYRERLGNPCIFSSIYKTELLKLSGDVGGKRVIENHKEDIWIYEVNNENELRDIDYLEDV